MNKNKTRMIVKPIHALLRSEPKFYITICLRVVTNIKSPRDMIMQRVFVFVIIIIVICYYYYVIRTAYSIFQNILYSFVIFICFIRLLEIVTRCVRQAILRSHNSLKLLI